MLLASHPTGNANVRALLTTLERADRLHSFHTTLAFNGASAIRRFLPGALSNELSRRAYPVPARKIVTYPLREAVRLVAQSARLGSLIKREQGWASIYQVYVDLDKRVAGKLSTMDKNVRGVYCYEDGAAETFKAAQKLGLARIYDLPIPYWRTTRVLLEEEAARLPEWEPTLVGTSDSQPKLERKTIELELADVVICNSRFTLNSLPEDIRRQKHCCIAEYGAPPIQTDESDRAATEKHAALRVLFAGSLSQRKGLADLFQAMKLLDSRELELVVMGSPVLPLEFYKQQYDRFIYEPPRSHAEVMKLMRSCDLFVFPSIVEGRGLVQMEAMACGLPLISTVNATADDFIQDGKNGFIVPIRAPEKIAEKLNWFLENRDAIQEMGEHARSTIQQWTWDSYSRKIIEALGTVGV